jgi:hypothetical protein
MATSRTITCGTTTCVIETHFHVDQDRPHGPHPAVATAFANDKEVTEENGQPVERSASTEEQAAANMCSYLEIRFGPKNVLNDLHPTLKY